LGAIVGQYQPHWTYLHILCLIIKYETSASK
jgi:hypothetical protein